MVTDGNNKPTTPESTVTSDSREEFKSLEKIVEELTQKSKVAVEASAEAKKQTAATLAEAQAKLEELKRVAEQAVAIQTQMVGEQTVVKEKSAHIQDAQEHANTVRSNLDRQLTAAQQQATEAEGQKARAQAASDAVTELLAAVRSAKAAIDKDATAAAQALKGAEQSAASTKGLSDTAAEIETRVAIYESQLSEFKAQYEKQLETIVGLLPGATTAGLAHDFDDRRKTFLEPQRKWDRLFVYSLSGIVVVAGISLVQTLFGSTPQSFEEIILQWLSRLPIVAALVWLALHSSHEAALAKRLEEDYGYKAVIASSFLGFNKQMLEVGSYTASNAPLAKLCGDTLTTIASPPGRIYDKHKLTVSPAGELRAATKDVTDALADVKAVAKS